MRRWGCAGQETMAVTSLTSICTRPSASPTEGEAPGWDPLECEWWAGGVSPTEGEGPGWGPSECEWWAGGAFTA